MPDQQATAQPPIEDDGGWLEQPQLPARRPRTRLLTPLPLTLLAVLLVACGFIGGVLVEKGQSSSSPAEAGAGGGGLAARFAALRGGAAAARTAGGGAGRAGAGFLGAGATGANGGAGGVGTDGGRTAGQVAYLSGATLYVTTVEGNTVRVNTSAGTTVSRTVSAHVMAIHPGEIVTITGTAGKDGAISAESIDVGSTGRGLAALFGAGTSRSGTAGTGGGAGAEAPALFGKGG